MPKDFWKLFRKSKSSKGKDIKVENFYSIFKSLANEINLVTNDEAEDFDNNHNFDQCDPIFDDLDVSITRDEVKLCLIAFKSGEDWWARQPFKQIFYRNRRYTFITYNRDIYCHFR